MSVQERDPCPHRILDDIGGAFSMGAIGGGVWYSVKGARNSPRGERLLGSITAIKARVPVIGGAHLRACCTHQRLAPRLSMLPAFEGALPSDCWPAPILLASGTCVSAGAEARCAQAPLDGVPCSVCQAPR